MDKLKTQQKEQPEKKRGHKPSPKIEQTERKRPRGRPKQQTTNRKF